MKEEFADVGDGVVVTVQAVLVFPLEQLLISLCVPFVAIQDPMFKGVSRERSTRFERRCVGFVVVIQVLVLSLGI